MLIRIIAGVEAVYTVRDRISQSITALRPLRRLLASTRAFPGLPPRPAERGIGQRNPSASLHFRMRQARCARTHRHDKRRDGALEIEISRSGLSCRYG